MKVSLLTNFIPPYWLPTFLKLRSELDDFRILISTAMEPDRDWAPQWRDLSVTVQRTWTIPCNWKHEAGFKEKIWRHLPYDTLPLLIRQRPDVIVSAQMGFRTMQAATYRRIFPRTRLVVWTPLSEHTEKGLSSARTLQRRVLLRSADAVIVNGTSGARYIAGLGVPPAKIFVLPCCADVGSHLKLPLDRNGSEARRLLYVGRLVELKGLAQFINAFSQSLAERPPEKWELWVAGDGPLRQDLQKLAACRGLNVSFLGNVPYEKVPEIYARCGVLVLPTLSDEWGVVVNEALASGLPVLGSVYSQAVEELVQDGKTGWTFRADRPTEMMAACNRALSRCKTQLGSMRQLCREQVRRLTPEFGAACFLTAIREARLRHGSDN